MTTLEQALALARAETAPERRVEHLVDAWRISRDLALAELIERFVEATAPTRAPVGTANDSFQQAWLTRAAETKTADLAHLFDSIARGTGPHCALRVKALERFAPHPHVAKVLTGWLLDSPFDGANRARCLGPALNVLRACGDPRSAATLADVTMAAARQVTIRNVGLKNWAALKELAGQAAQWSVSKPVDSLDGLDAPAKSRRVDLQPLWNEVFAEPDDTQRKLVLADALQDQGDPRGEFIALQLARTAKQRPTKREKELLAQYRETWMGSIALALRSPEYESGLLVGGRLRGTIESLQTALEHPAWQGVRRIDVERVRTPLVVGTLSNPRASRIEQLTGMSSAPVVDLLGVGAQPWKHLEVPWSNDETLQVLADAHRNVPKLSTLAVRETDIGSFASTTLGARLRGFGMWTNDGLPELFTAFRDTKLERLVLAAPRLVLSLELRTRALRVFVTSYEGQAIEVPEGLSAIELVHEEGFELSQLRQLKRVLQHAGPVAKSVGAFRDLRELLLEVN